MKRSPHIALLLFASLAGQLAVASGSDACFVSAQGSPSEAMSNMRMDGMGTTPSLVLNDSPSGKPADDRVPDQQPCDEPSNTGVCRLLIPCGGSFVASGGLFTTVATVLPERVCATLDNEPESRLFPPDVPPPRA